MKTILTIVVLIVAGAVMTRLVIWNGETVAQPAVNSVAVLPFESLSPENEGPFFADGIRDGVSTRLAKVINLKVTRQNSANVAYVLKGSVRHERGEECHDRIHFYGQLIDTRTHAKIWTQEYDRELCKVWQLQCEIAQTVAESVHIERRFVHD